MDKQTADKGVAQEVESVMEGIRIIVCGGRDYSDSERMFSVLDKLCLGKGIDCVIHGDAFGADKIAGAWAISRGIACEAVPANWKKHGKAAGPMRNLEMLRLDPDLVVAFPGGRGTANMKRNARRAGIEVMEIQ